MSAFLAFSVPPCPIGSSVRVVDYTYQPPCTPGRGPSPLKPLVDDSAIITVFVEPKFSPIADGVLLLPEGVSIIDAALLISWSAAGRGYLTAEVDLLHGVPFSIAATSLTVEAQVKVSDPAAAVAAGVMVGFDAVVGRTARANGGRPTRTKSVGTVPKDGGSSIAVQVPPFARSVALVTSTSGAGFAATIVQRSGAVVVQRDQVQPPAAPVPLNFRADNIVVQNDDPDTDRDVWVVFGIDL